MKNNNHRSKFSARKTSKARPKSIQYSMAAMASADIQIVNIPNLAKIESFFNDATYRELLENSENYNTRLCIERRLRMPFLDQQTGVAQTNCALFMKRRHRMPGIREGQIYTYPAAKWRKSKRQYLHHRPFRMVREPDADSNPLDRSAFVTGGIGGGGVVGVGGVGVIGGDSESKDSHHSLHPESKEWFYDDDVMHDVDPFEDRGDSDFDYDDNHYKKKRRSRKTPGDIVANRRGGRGRGRGRRNNKAGGECDTPRSTNKRHSENKKSFLSLSANEDSQTQLLLQPSSVDQQLSPQIQHDFMLDKNPVSAVAAAVSAGVTIGMDKQNIGNIGGGGGGSGSGCNMIQASEEEERLRIIRKPNDTRNKAPPSPYCDFCLGDARENRKTNVPEDLVSCSDCGRSGHPTCLQFTPNMIISVKRYRWQCIECKYCSICGTSDNDDQLLFCDDCDRGYHMYCLSPPLTSPPEGLWSCNICNKEFHSGK